MLSVRIEDKGWDCTGLDESTTMACPDMLAAAKLVTFSGTSSTIEDYGERERGSASPVLTISFKSICYHICVPRMLKRNRQ